MPPKDGHAVSSRWYRDRTNLDPFASQFCCWLLFSREPCKTDWLLSPTSFFLAPPEEYFLNVPNFLSRSATCYLYHGLAAKTRENYSTQWRSFIKYYVLIGTLPSFPTSLCSLCGWVAHLGDQRTTKSQTIKVYVKGLKSYHVDIGYSSSELEIFSHSTIKPIIDGIKREQEDEIAKKRLSMTKTVLLKLLLTLDVTIAERVNLHTEYRLAFARFLRIGELTYSGAKRTS